MTKSLCQTLKGEKQKRIPVWFMRQAGRYLPEYQQIRRQFDHFLDFCFSPREACAVTLQPLRRFDLDAAILFSDILVMAHALGQKVSFQPGHGPILSPIDLDKLRYRPAELDPVLETISLVKQTLGSDKALIGFCGAPWTVATYMIEGGGSKTYQKTKVFAYQNPEKFTALLQLLAETSADYLIGQIEAGVDTVKIFDSWASVVPAERFYEWVIRPTQIIVEKVKHRYPEIPIIGFPKGVGLFYKDYLETGIDAVTIDPCLPRRWALDSLSSQVILQGGLDPLVVAAGGRYLDQQVDTLLETFGAVPYIFNLGHGFVPETPIANIHSVIQRVRDFEKR